MARLIDPPREQHHKLLTQLNDGEKLVIDLFDAHLQPEWEIYIQPHLNGLRPDIVLLHPNVGVAVFEIKDWDFNALHYYAKPIENGRQILMARDKAGNNFSRESENPIRKIQLYKDELFNLYCPRLDSNAGFAVITAGLIFPSAMRSQVEPVLSPFRKLNEGMQKYPKYYPISGIEEVISGNLNAIFPESIREASLMMDKNTADDLRGWLKEPYFSQEQRTPLELDARQKDLATTRTESGYRRIKGPAGSGKSVVIAARASSLAAEGKTILVVSYNITLLNYLRDLAARHEASRNLIRRQIDFLNFHCWCKRVSFEAGYGEEYNSLWVSSPDGTKQQSDYILNEGLPSFVQQLYSKDTGHNIMPRYDAILVDEGQDFRPSWWQTLRLALKVGGEMVLVADKTQNIYGTAAAWTEDVMANSGFRGPWAELKISYRLPPIMVPLVSKFAKDFLANEEIDIPQLEKQNNQMEFANFFPVELRWVHVEKYSDELDALVSEVRRMMQRLRTDTAIPDITVLSNKELGRHFIDTLEIKGVHVIHTFAEDKQNSQRQKRAFFQGDARIKATTLHSFKGWESRHLILFIKSINRPEDRALIYTALTRIRRHQEGSALTVLSCCTELLAYGKSWPDFFQYER